MFRISSNVKGANFHSQVAILKLINHIFVCVGFRHNSQLVEFLRANRDFNFLKPHGRDLWRLVCNHLKTSEQQLE